MAADRAEKNWNAPYYVAMRDAERGILRDFLTATDGSIGEAAKTLGVTYQHVHQRAKLLGGVLPNEPRREPFSPKRTEEKASDAKHQDDGNAAEDDGDDDDRSAADSDGETDRTDDT